MNSANQKILEKKSSQRSAKKRYLYSHEYRDQKNGGKKREKKIFPEAHRFHKQTTMEKNRLKKVRKNVFLINT